MFADKNVVSVIELFRHVLESADVNCDNAELEWFSLKWKCIKSSHFVAKSQMMSKIKTLKWKVVFQTADCTPDD